MGLSKRSFEFLSRFIARIKAAATVVGGRGGWAVSSRSGRGGRRGWRGWRGVFRRGFKGVNHAPAFAFHAAAGGVGVFAVEKFHGVVDVHG